MSKKNKSKYNFKILYEKLEEAKVEEKDIFDNIVEIKEVHKEIEYLRNILETNNSNSHYILTRS